MRFDTEPQYNNTRETARARKIKLLDERIDARSCLRYCHKLNAIQY